MRSEMFQYFLTKLDLDDETGTLCSKKLYDYNGSGRIAAFWDPNFCQLVKSYATIYSVYNSQDYKRCVC